MWGFPLPTLYILRWWKARRAGKSGGPTVNATLTMREPYEVLQYWHQTGWEVLFKQPPYPKLVRMRDTGQVVELKHPNPSYGKREDS